MYESWCVPATITGMTPARAWLVHPVTLLAVAVLLVNDHLLKATHPGVVTGKLSDVAGLVVVPPILACALALVLRRGVAAVALTVTGVGFVAVKAFAPGAAVASAVWSAVSGPSVVRADLTDLVALPALGLAWWAWSRARHQRVDLPRRIGVLVVLPIAALAVAATSAPEYPDAIAVTARDGMLFTGQGDAYREGRRVEIWQASEDGGRTWRHPDEGENTVLAALSTVDVTARMGCVPDEPTHCYRAVPEHLMVEETTDGGTTWTVSWQVTDNQREVLARSFDGLDDPAVYLSSNSLAVQSVPDGHAVVVANGRDGFARRDADGRWERIGFATTRYGGTRPPAPLEPDPRNTLWREAALMALAGLFVVGIGGWRGSRRGSVAVGLFLGALGAGAGLVMIGALSSLSNDDLFGVLFAAAGVTGGLVAALVGGVGTLGMAAGTRDLPARWAWLIVGLGVVVALTGFAVFVGWVNDLYPYRVAGPDALVVTLAGVVAAGWLGQRYGIRAHKRVEKSKISAWRPTS